VPAAAALVRRIALEKHRGPRGAMLIALGRIGGAEARRALAAELRADGPDATLAARALALMGAEGIPELAAALREGEYPVQVRAALALSKVELPEAVPIWREVLRERSVAARHCAVDALQAIGTPEAVAGLCEAVANPWGRVSRSAARRLERYLDPALIGPEHTPHLCAILGVGSTALRLRAADALATLALSAPDPILRDALEPLERLAGFFSGEPGEARDRYRRCRDRIADALRGTADLPLSAHPPRPEADGLPRSSTPPPAPAGQLPRHSGLIPPDPTNMGREAGCDSE
jgi:HEAT repeat protein